MGGENWQQCYDMLELEEFQRWRKGIHGGGKSMSGGPEEDLHRHRAPGVCLTGALWCLKAGLIMPVDVRWWKILEDHTKMSRFYSCSRASPGRSFKYIFLYKSVSLLWVEQKNFSPLSGNCGVFFYPSSCPPCSVDTRFSHWVNTQGN